MITDRTVADFDARDRAATDLDTTCLVEAAAGTGKTTLLVERVLNIVRRWHTPLSKVAAITFTEKAAGELKIKLRRRLEESAREDSTDAPYFRNALLELDNMPVSTIHSFCRELIQERPVEAGVEPHFAVASQTEAELLRSDVWQEWIAGQFATDCPAARPFLERNIPAGESRGSSLRDVYDIMLDYREDLAELHVPCLNDEDLASRITELKDALQRDLKVLSNCSEAADKLAVELKKITAWCKVKHGQSLTELAAWLENAPKLAGQRGRKENWKSAESLDTARELRKSFPDRVQEMYGYVVSRWAHDLVKWLKGAANEYEQAKIQRTLLDFHDLLLYARDMLRHSQAAREFFKRRFDFLLIDEFQDTDPLQSEIIFYLAEEKGTFADDWHQVKLEPGKLFIVGDPKQSIYRFRRADLDLYGHIKFIIESHGQRLNIRVNFRSGADLLSEVNDIFTAHMTGPRNGRYEPQYVPLEAHATVPGEAPPLVILAPPEGWWAEKPDARTQAQAEAACIAAYLKEQHDQQGRRYGNVGVLYSATTHLLELENALRASDIPYQVSGGKKLIERAEVIALRTVVAALANPFDEVNVVGALRSPFFACSDEELLRQRLSHRGFNYLREQGIEPWLEECMVILRDLHAMQETHRPGEILVRLFERTRGLHIYALKPQGEVRVANLLKLLDIARAENDGEEVSLHSFARRLARLDEARSGEEDSVTVEAGDDVVQLLTFHKAKGLEFPVVVLFRLGHERDRRETVIIDRATKSLHLSAGYDLQTSGFAVAQEDERDRDSCESMRLLYVAMTRAREQLVVPAYWSESSRGFHKLLSQRLPADQANRPDHDKSRFVRHNTSSYPRSSPPAEALKIELSVSEDSPIVRAALSKREQWEETRAAAARQLVRSEYAVAPSHEAEEEEAGPGEEFADSGGHGVEFGKMMHRIFQRLSLADGSNLEEAIRSAANEFAIGEPGIAAARRYAESALASELFDRIRKADTVYRELPFTLLQDERLRDGVIDLIFIEDGQAVIIDYKTDAVTAEQAPDHSATYRQQMRTYREALQTITRIPVKETILYFLRPNCTVRVED